MTRQVTKLKLNAREAPYIAAQLYGVPHWILWFFNTIIYENEFQNTFHQHLVLMYRKLSLSIIDNFAIFLVIDYRFFVAKIIDNSR
jgi:hypothetical protein